VSRIFDIARGALSAFGSKLQGAAANIANMNSPGYRPSVTTLASRVDGGVEARLAERPEGDTVDISTEAVAMIEAEHGVKAAVVLIKTEDERQQTTLDILG